MANKRACTVCGTKYEYCGNCSKYNSEETWRYLYCSNNCYEIGKVYDQYRWGNISANEAVDRFKNFEMPTIDKFSESKRPVIEEIYAKVTPIVAEEAPVIEEITTAEDTQEVGEAMTAGIVEETPVEIPIKIGRRKRSTVTE